LLLGKSPKWTVAKFSRYKQHAYWLTNVCSTGYKLDMAFRKPVAPHRARTAYNSDGEARQTVQVPAVSAIDTTVNRNKRNLTGRGKEKQLQSRN
jgi:hypothetical protein